MLVDNKLNTLKSFLSENRLNNGGAKTTINQSAVQNSEESVVDLSLKNPTPQKFEKKAKKKKQLVLPEEKKSQVVTEEETAPATKEKNLRLLNLL